MEYNKLNKKLKKKIIISVLLIVALTLNSFASLISDNDGPALVTKAEFSKLKQTIYEEINSYSDRIDEKIDGAIETYLGQSSFINAADAVNIYKELDQRQPILWSSNPNYAMNGTKKHKYNWKCHLLMEYIQSNVCGAGGLNSYIATPSVFKIFYNGNDATRASYQLIEYDPILNWLMIKCNYNSNAVGTTEDALPNNSIAPTTGINAYFQAPTANDNKLKFSGLLNSSKNLPYGSEFYNYITLFAPKKTIDSTTKVVMAPFSDAVEYVYDENLANTAVVKKPYSGYEFEPSWIYLNNADRTNLTDNKYSIYGYYWDATLPWCEKEVEYNKLKFNFWKYNNTIPDSSRGIWITKNVNQDDCQLSFLVTADQDGTLYLYQSDSLSKNIKQSIANHDPQIQSYKLYEGIENKVNNFLVSGNKFCIGAFLPDDVDKFSSLDISAISFVSAK